VVNTSYNIEYQRSVYICIPHTI